MTFNSNVIEFSYSVALLNHEPTCFVCSFTGTISNGTLTVKAGKSFNTSNSQNGDYPAPLIIEIMCIDRK